MCYDGSSKQVILTVMDRIFSKFRDTITPAIELLAPAIEYFAPVIEWVKKVLYILYCILELFYPFADCFRPILDILLLVLQVIFIACMTAYNVIKNIIDTVRDPYASYDISDMQLGLYSLEDHDMNEKPSERKTIADYDIGRLNPKYAIAVNSEVSDCSYDQITSTISDKQKEILEKSLSQNILTRLTHFNSNPHYKFTRTNVSVNYIYNKEDSSLTVHVNYHNFTHLNVDQEKLYAVKNNSLTTINSDSITVDDVSKGSMESQITKNGATYSELLTAKAIYVIDKEGSIKTSDVHYRVRKELSNIFELLLHKAHIVLLRRANLNDVDKSGVDFRTHTYSYMLQQIVIMATTAVVMCIGHMTMSLNPVLWSSLLTLYAADASWRNDVLFRSEGPLSSIDFTRERITAISISFIFGAACFLSSQLAYMATSYALLLHSLLSPLDSSFYRHCKTQLTNLYHETTFRARELFSRKEAPVSADELTQNYYVEKAISEPHLPYRWPQPCSQP